ncbi:chaperone NapD [Oleidesulfovibrio sp.]|uniref:chaperone NapD n=1 Tax=Oleidesulfovibrio sp. TaxID=2909707 RepID=UPI003A8927FE
MAVAGIILHAESSRLQQVRAVVAAEKDMTIYGEHDNQYLVVVGEVPSAKLEDRIQSLEAVPGVLAVYTTYVNIEDEQGGQVMP